MNGVFTERDARYLTIDEYAHYFSLGLVPMLTSDVLDQSIYRINSDLQYALSETHDALDRVEELENENENLTARITELEAENDSLNKKLASYESRSK